MAMMMQMQMPEPIPRPSMFYLLNNTMSLIRSGGILQAHRPLSTVFLQCPTSIVFNPRLRSAS
jgi:hypothetical protein